MKVEYDSNNSGGSWWLTDENWKDLEKGGWVVDWNTEEGGGRRLGALATSATREGMGLKDAVEEWEQITGKSSTDAGCPCCGPPHSFTEYDNKGDYVSSGPDTSYEASW